MALTVCKLKSTSVPLQISEIKKSSQEKLNNEIKLPVASRKKEQLLEMLAFTLLVISCWLSCFMNLVRVFTWAECVISRWVVAARIVLR